MAKHLGEVAWLWRWDLGLSDEVTQPVDERSNAAVVALLTAKESEARGLQRLGQIVQAL